MRLQLTSVLVLASVVAIPLGARQPAAPSIQTFTANNGDPQTTTDQVTLRWTYTHPAAVGQPIAGVRIRYRPPGGTWPAWPGWVSGSQWNATATMPLATTNGAPRLGPHDFEIQLRDSLNQLSATKTTRISRVTTSTTSLARPRQRHRVDGRTAMRFASETGFGFAKVVINANSTCTLDWYNNVMEAYLLPTNANIGARPRCRFDFFVNKKLRAGWRMVGAHFANGENPQILVFQQRPSGTEQPFFSIEVIRNYKFRLEHIELEGPSGADWRDAFRY